jgi:hypothetical protein
MSLYSNTYIDTTSNTEYILIPKKEYNKIINENIKLIDEILLLKRDLNNIYNEKLLNEIINNNQVINKELNEIKENIQKQNIRLDILENKN